MKPTYLLDANVFIQAKNLYYGFDFCPAFWDWLDEANADGTVFSIERVQDEIVAGDDQLSEWVRQRPNLFLKPDDSAAAREGVTAAVKRAMVVKSTHDSAQHSNL